MGKISSEAARLGRQVGRKLGVGGKTADKAAQAIARQSVDKLVLSSPTFHNKISFHVTPVESQQAVLDSIRNAKKSFHIETFIWHNDESGRAIIDALGDRIAKAKAKGDAFDAKVLIDTLGLRQGSGGSNDVGIVDLLRKKGVEVLEFNPKYVSMEAMGIPITHRKLYIADGEKFITGGRNFGNEYLEKQYTLANGKTEYAWHDLLFTVEGDETARIEKEFFENWVRAGGKAPAVLPKPVPAKGSARVQSVVTDPHAKQFSLEEAHFKAIRGAQQEIVAIYPYFSYDKLVKELIEAKRANPKLSIKVLLPANKEASHEGTIYSLLNQENARQMLNEGIEVRLFNGGKVDGKDVQRFSHFKGMMVDGKLLSIGSANGDARTYYSNHELNTLIADKTAIKEFSEKVIRPDWAAGVPLTLEEIGEVTFKEKAQRKLYEAFDFLL